MKLLNGIRYLPRVDTESMFDSSMVGLPLNQDTPMILKELCIHKVRAGWQRNEPDKYIDIKTWKLDDIIRDIKNNKPVHATWLYFSLNMEGRLCVEDGRHTLHAIFNEMHNTALFAIPESQESMFDPYLP